MCEQAVDHDLTLGLRMAQDVRSSVQVALVWVTRARALVWVTHARALHRAYLSAGGS